MRYYDPSKNPDGAHLDGVPLRDLTDDDLAALPPWLRASVEVCGFYTTDAPPRPTPEPTVSLTVLASQVADLASKLAPEDEHPPSSDAEEPSPRRRR